MAEIIVGVDGSEMSRSALRWAAAVARERGDSVRAVMSWQYPAHAGAPTGPTALPPAADMDRATEAELRGVLADELGSDAAEVRAEVGRGPAADVLLHRAREGGVDLLVLGARGLGGFDGLLLGSVSQECVEHAPCPVAVIRGDAAVPPARILVGIDGSDGSQRALAWAIGLAEPHRAEIVAVHAAPIGASPEDLEEADRIAREEWSEPLRRSDVPHSVRVEHTDPRSSLQRSAEEDGADVLVVGARGLGPLAGLLLGSVAGYLVRYAALPVVVVPPADRRA